MFKKGRDLAIFVTAVSKVGNQCCVWGQTDFEAFGVVNELVSNVNAEDKNTFKPAQIDTLQVGEVVIAKYTEDAAWYRAQVLSIQKATSICKVKVLFMDYGNEETVSINDIVYGPDEYFQIPPLADKFLLADIQPQDGKAFSVSETEKLKEHLMNLDTVALVMHDGAVGVPPTLRPFLKKGSEMPVFEEIIRAGCGTYSQNNHMNFPSMQRSVITKGQPHHVYVSYAESAIKFWLQLVSQEDALLDLNAQTQEVAPSLSAIPQQQILCGQLCIAKYEEIYYRGVVSSQDHENQTAHVTFADYGNSADIPFSEVLGLPAEYCTLPAQAIECSLSGAVNNTELDKLTESETVYAETLSVAASGLHVVSLSNDPGHTAAARLSANPPIATRGAAPTPSIVTSYSPMQFDLNAYVDICISNVEENGQFHCQLLAKAPALNVLMGTIQEAPQTPLKGAIKEGTCCLARSASDMLIYRAQILSGSVAGPHVKYVDFGTAETVPANNLYHLPTEFAAIPVHAVCCSLSDSAALTAQQVTQLLGKYDSKKPVVGKVVLQTSKSYDIALYDTTLSDESLVSVMSKASSTRPVATVPTVPSQVPLRPLSSAFSAGSLQPPNITMGQPSKVIGSVVFSPSLFFAQFDSCPVEDLEELGSSLHDFYTNNDVPCLGSCSAGDLCVAQYSEDGGFYRARVKDRRNDQALVSFVDYGNQEKKSVSELRVLVPQFCKMPVAGALFDMEKYHEAARDKVTLEEVIVEQELTVICEEHVPDRHKFISKLANTESNTAALMVMRPKAPERVAQPTSTANMQPKPSVAAISIPEGTSTEVIVSHVTDPDNFMVQLVQHKEELDHLMELIDAYCQQPNTNPHYRPALADVVIAMYDAGWYRAKITGVKKSGQEYEVYFVDYGNYEVVAVSDLREIPAELMTLARQGVNCKLHGVEQPAYWEAVHVDQLYDAIMDCQLMVQVVKQERSTGMHTVELLRDGVSINNTFLMACGKLSRNHHPPQTRSSRPEPGQEHGKIITPKNIKLEEYTNFVVSFGESVDKFWCQLFDDAVQLEKMQAAIAADYATSSDLVECPVAGMFCCALYSKDETWCRAQIKEVDGNTVSVEFVDYGNQDRVTLGSLRVLKDKYYLLSRQAIQCQLFGVEPLEGDEWSEQANNLFRDLALPAKSIVGCPVQKNDDGSYVVELVHANSEPFHEKLIQGKLAKSPMSPAGPQSARRPVVAPQVRTSNKFSPAAALSPSATPTAESTIKLKPLMLKNMEAVDVYVVHVDAIARIFCQLVSEASKLCELMERIAESYAYLGPSELRLKNCQVGMVCCAKYSIDGVWYRGEIVHVVPGKLHVRFVDYGDEEWVESENVRQIIKQFLSLPMQAIHVSLDNVTSVRGKETQAKVLLEQKAEGAVFQLIPRTRSIDGVHMATIILNELSISQSLVQAGVAAPSRQQAVSNPPSSQLAPQAASNPGPAPVPVSGTYSMHKLVVALKYKVQVCWVISPLEFYCQSVDSEQHLCDLAECLEKEYTATMKLNQMALPNPKPGAACVAYYEDDSSWYRGTILKVRGNEALVKYVDYGNRSRVPFRMLKAPTEYLVSLPMEAVQCCLKGVDKATTDWPDTVNTLFQTMMKDQPELEIVSLEGDRYIVDITTDTCKSIAERVSMLMGAPQDGRGGSTAAQRAYSDRGGTGRADKRACGDRYADRLPRSTDSGFGSREGVPSSREGKTVAAQGNPARPDAAWGDAKQSLVPHTAVPSPSQKLTYPQGVVKTGSQECYLASVTSPQQFFVQFVSQEGELATFAEQVSGEYSALSPGDRAVTSLAVNEPCCALFADDEVWYRALVTDVLANEATVLFVDYGNSTTVNFSQIRLLSSKLVSVPLYAQECKLRGMETYTADDVAKLLELAGEKSFKVVFFTKTAPFEVSVFDGDTNVLDLLPSGRLTPPRPASIESQQMPANGASHVTSPGYEPLQKPADGVAYVSHIVSPGEFYLQFAEHEDLLATLTDEIQAAAPSAPALPSVTAGAPCAAVYSQDQAWYRAQIVSVTDQKAVVQFVDHGNCEEVDVSGLKKVHTICPPIAVLSQLGPRKDWDEATIDKFSEMVLEKTLQVSLRGEKHTYTATMTDTETELIINDAFDQAEVPAVLQADVQANVNAETSQTVCSFPEFDASSLTGRIQVFVSHVDNPSSFYIQLVRSETDLNEMLDSLDEKYKSEQCERIVQPRVGMACCAKYSEDGVFYRATVTDIKDGLVTVHFVDYGNCDTPSAGNIYQLQPDSPRMAVHCTLAGLQEPEGGWTENMGDRLLELTVDKILTAELHTVGDICRISLFEQEQNIANILQEAFPQIQTASVESAQAEAEATLESETTPTPCAEDETPAAVPEAARQSYIQQDCPQEAIPVFVSAVTSPSRFYVHPASISDDLTALTEKVASVYREGNMVALASTAILPDQACCAQSADDEEWYRAVITDCQEDTCTVMYVDYGNTEVLPTGALKQLVGEVLLQPIMAMECCLAGFPTVDEWTQDEVHKFLGDTTDKELSMAVVSGLAEPYTVSLKEEGEDVATRLFAGRLNTGDADVDASIVNASCNPEVIRSAVFDADTPRAQADYEEVVPAQLEQVEEQAESKCQQEDTDEQQPTEHRPTEDPNKEECPEKETPAEESGDAAAGGCLSARYKLTCGACEKLVVVVSWVESPSTFYIQLPSKVAELSGLEDSLHSFYSSQEDREVPDPLQTGLICAAQYGDEEEGVKWYRARVQSIAATEDVVEVFFLDWGNTETVPVTYLRPLTEQFLSLPPQCFPCRLANMQPITDEWPDEATAAFEEKVTASDSLVCLPLLFSDMLYEVDLLDQGQSVADYMKKQGHAIEIREQEEDDRVKFVTDIAPATLNTEMKTQVCISHLNSPHSFSVQMKPDAVLDHLVTDMLAFYTSSDTCPAPVTDIMEGRCYAVKSEESCDRARVEAITDQDVINIVYVDYGYKNPVSREQIYPLAAQFGMPALCFPCHLVGVAPKDEHWSEEATELMRELTADKCLILQVVEHMSDEYAVRLLDMGIPISQVLAENNMAQLVDIKHLPGTLDAARPTDNMSDSVGEFIEEIIASAKAIAEHREMEGRSLAEVVKDELMSVNYLHGGDSPHNFYVQLCDGAEFTELEQSLQGHYERAQHATTELKEDDNVLVCEQDKCYRASVVFLQGEDKLKLRLLDYGRLLTVARECVHVPVAGQEEVFRLPSQAMACRLEGVESAQWTPQAMDFFEGAVRGSPLTVRILSQDEADVYSVYLYVTLPRDAAGAECSINMQLVQEGHATVIPGCQLDIDLDLETHDNAELENSFFEETKLHSNSIGCLEDNSLYEAPDKSFAAAAAFTDLRYSAGDVIRMRVSRVTDPDNIAVVDCTDTDTAAVLSQQMQEHYKGAGDQASMLSQLSPGLPAAVFRASRWQRAKLVSVREDTVDMLLVDTGLQLVVYSKELRVLEQRFLTLPAQACSVSLDTEEGGSSWPQDVRETLECACGVGKKEDYVSMTVRSVEEDGHLVVNITNKDGVDLCTLCKEVDSTEVVASDEDNEEEQEEEVEYAATIPIRSVAVGDQMAVRVTIAESPVMLWCQVLPEDAATLAEKIQATYSSPSSRHTIPADAPALEEGSVCAVLLSAADDDAAVPRWCRAEIRSSYDDVFSVQCCDTGRLGTVPRDSLRRLTLALAQDARHALLCQIPDILPPDSSVDWVHANGSTYVDLCSDIDEQMTVLHVPSDDSPVHVSLTTSSGKQDVREYLISQLLAKPTPVKQWKPRFEYVRYSKPKIESCPDVREETREEDVEGGSDDREDEDEEIVVGDTRGSEDEDSGLAEKAVQHFVEEELRTEEEQKDTAEENTAEEEEQKDTAEENTAEEEEQSKAVESTKSCMGEAEYKDDDLPTEMTTQDFKEEKEKHDDDCVREAAVPVEEQIAAVGYIGSCEGEDIEEVLEGNAADEEEGEEYSDNFEEEEEDDAEKSDDSEHLEDLSSDTCLEMEIVPRDDDATDYMPEIAAATAAAAAAAESDASKLAEVVDEALQACGGDAGEEDFVLTKDDVEDLMSNDDSKDDYEEAVDLMKGESSTEQIENKMNAEESEVKEVHEEDSYKAEDYQDLEGTELLVDELLDLDGSGDGSKVHTMHAASHSVCVEGGDNAMQTQAPVPAIIVASPEEELGQAAAAITKYGEDDVQDAEKALLPGADMKEKAAFDGSGSTITFDMSASELEQRDAAVDEESEYLTVDDVVEANAEASK